MFDDPLVRRLIKQTVIWLTLLGVMMFLVAGTFDWPGALVLLIESGVLGVISGVRIARHDPQLLQERMRGPIQKEQKPWDKRLLTVIFSLCLLMPIVAGLEVRFGTSAVPVSLQVLGALALAFGFYVFHVVMETNSFASAVVRIQSERGQKVISTGPYAYVRHPMYGGAIAYFSGSGCCSVPGTPSASGSSSSPCSACAPSGRRRRWLASSTAMPPTRSACATG